MLIELGKTFLLAALITPLPVDEGPKFVTRTIKVQQQEFAYQVFLPAGWSPTQKWPTVLYLHGLGERGSEGARQTEVGLGPAVRRNSERFPTVIVMPQCSRGVVWNDSVMEELVLATLDRSIVEFNGDPKRVYLTGISMGGYGTFYFGAKYPERFAALAPICGGVRLPREARNSDIPATSPPYLDVARRIKGIPTWIFHGGVDRRVPTSESRKMEEALNHVGADVKYTEYDGVGHNSWDLAYAEPELVQWLLSKSLP